ncbi:MAG: AAA family ATPase [Actinomycetes bacterium]
MIHSDESTAGQMDPVDVERGMARLTLEQMKDGLEVARRNCKQADEPAWQLLQELAIELTVVERDDSLVNGYRWCLMKVEIEGFRGASTPLSIAFESGPGVTVLHGENGSGKSSITEALRMALEGQVGLTHLGAKGRVHQLWGSVDERSKGADQASVEVHFRDAADPRIHLLVVAHFDGTRVHRIATLTLPDGAQTEFPSDSAAWKSWDSAIRTSPPVFAYAELANELQKRNDLQTWLSSCLAMDAASREFNAAVIERQGRARDAKSALEQIRAAAQDSLQSIDDRAAESGLEGIGPIAWDELDGSTELDEWLRSQELSSRDRLDELLPRDLYQRLDSYADEHRRLTRAWNDASTVALTQRAMTAIVDLDAAVEGSPKGDDAGQCPVCGSPNENWRAHLHDQAVDFAKAKETASALTAHVRTRNEGLVSPLQASLTALPVDYGDQASVVDATKLLTACRSQLSATNELDASVIETVDDLCAWVKTQTAKTLVETAVSVADLRHHWLCDRWAAMEPFVDAWVEHHAHAALADTWKTALSRWNSHLSKIRQERSSRLRDLVSPAITSLLSDVGIRLDVLDVNKNDIKLILKDRKGDEVELSHLSAGQRNALILGPVLGTAAGGIFQFCLIDDPVHAFDDFRVDQLAATMTKMSARQSLILTTHDGRFVEYLRVHAPLSFNVYITSRDDMGTITLERTEAPWQIVLDHASSLLSAAGARITRDGLSDLCALLRMGTDEGLEALSLRYLGTLGYEDRARDSLEFAQAMSIKERIGRLRAFLASSPQQLADFDSACGHVSGYIKVWSKSSHDGQSSPTSQELATQITAARNTCGLLEKIRW